MGATAVAEGFDCSAKLTTELAALFFQDQKAFAIRYYGTDWKRLFRDEAEIISNAGLGIVTVFETTAQRPLNGYDAGYADGSTAGEQAAEAGQPEDISAIYAAIDFEPTSSQLPTVADYIRGFNDATPQYMTGAYACYKAICYLQNVEACSRFWQTYAWSYGNVADGIHLLQYQNGVSAHGIQVDWTRSFGNAGSWSLKAQDPPVFSDVPGDHWCVDNLELLKNAGIIDGFEDGTFRGDRRATRYEVAAMIANLYSKLS